MTIEQRDDHVEVALSRLPDRFRKEFIQAFTQVMAEEVQELEDAAFSVIFGRGLGNAVGVQLDELGLVLRETRAGRTDSQYRVGLQTRVLRNRSNGEIERILTVVRVLAATTQVVVTDRGNANIQVVYEKDSPPISEADIAVAVREIKAGGVGVHIIKTLEGGLTFGFNDDGQPDNADVLGFGDTLDPLKGGNFASVM